VVVAAEGQVGVRRFGAGAEAAVASVPAWEAARSGGSVAVPPPLPSDPAGIRMGISLDIPL
jgi:hypothetical protein